MTSMPLPCQRAASSQPSHTPSPRMSLNTSRRALIVRKPSMNSAWRAFTPSSTSVVLITSKAAPATAQASGLPPKVVPWTPTENALAISLVVSIAPMGNPPPSPLALVRMSGTTPFCMYEKSAPVRPMPLWISSKMSSASCSSHRRRAAGEEFGRSWNHAAFALHGLEDHCTDVVATFFGKGGLEAADVVVANMRKAGRRRPEAGGILCLSSCRDREQRPPVKCVEGRNHPEFFRPASDRAHNGAPT